METNKLQQHPYLPRFPDYSNLSIGLVRLSNVISAFNSAKDISPRSGCE